MNGMTVEEYMHVLQEIESNLAYLDADAADEIVNRIFSIKPVRLEWYLVKAKIMLKQGKSVSSILDFLSDKCQPWYLYEGVNEYFELLSSLYETEGDLWQSRRQKYQLNRLKEFSGEQNIENKEIDDKMNVSLYQAVRSKHMDPGMWNELIEMSYISGNIYLYLLLQIAANSLYPQSTVGLRPEVMEKYNVEYYYERLVSSKNETFVIIETTEADGDMCLLMAKALSVLEKRAIIFKAPVAWEKGDFQQSVEMSEKSVQWNEKICTMDTFYIEQQERYDNRGALLDLAAQKYAEDQLVTVLAAGYLIDEIAIRNEYKPKMERLTEAEGDYLQDRIAVAKYGNYLSFVANIFKTTKDEMEKLLYRKPVCKFSIIIPCRNADEMLISVLKTCLNQTYQGDYEIVVSDNSEAEWGMDTPVYRMCKAFHDDRIKYYRTPRNLSLSKAFEFAYLHASGEFLLAMGSDDGILPYALEVLENCIQEQPQFSVFLWHQASYKWGGLEKGSRITKGAELFVRNENQWQVWQYKSKDMFSQLFLEYGYLYYLPMFYHNSGMRRSYMATIYERTGVLWDGHCQDISMAVTTSCIEKELCFIDLILTIDALSVASIGINCMIGNNNLEQMDIVRREKNTSYQGTRMQGYYERLFPHTYGADSGLYSCMMYAYAIGVITDEMLEEFDWKEMYKKVTLEIRRADILYDAQIHRIRYAVSLHGQEMLEWFDETLYHDLMQPVKIETQTEAAAENEIDEYVEILGKKMDVAPGTISDVYRASIFLQNLFDGRIKE